MRRLWITQIGVVLIAWSLAGAHPPDGPISNGQGYAVDPGITGSTVRGLITYRGSIPSDKPLSVTRDVEYCGTTVTNEGLLVDRFSKGVAAVVVSLEGVTKGKAFPAEKRVVLENEGCRFSPRIRAVSVGSLIEINNTDPVLHNTHIRKGNATFLNVALPAKGKPIRKPLAEAAHLDVRCDAHQFMRASLHVFAHPYFAVTDQAGMFEIPQVPPGTYSLRVWHETLGFVEKPVTVPGTGEVTVNLKLGSGE
jgi:plastocyanin